MTITKEVAQFRATLCPSLTPNGSGASCCRLGLLAHKTKKDDTSFNAHFTIEDYKSQDDLAGCVKAELGNLKLKEAKAIISDGSLRQVSSGEPLVVCSPFIVSLFVAIAPLKSDSMALTPCQPAVHLRPASLSQDLLTPATMQKTYIEHIASGGDKDLFRQPLETIIYSTDPEVGAAVSPVEILNVCQFRQIPKGSLANHVKLAHVQDAFHLLVAQKQKIPHFLPTHLRDQDAVPIVLFFTLLAALHQKYDGLKSDADWLALLSALTGLPQPQQDLSVSSTADLHYITRVLFAEKVRCKIAIAKGLRRFLLTYHISQFEQPPETLQDILKPRLLCVSDTGIFSDPCPLTVTATAAGPHTPAAVGTPTTFEEMMAEDRSRRMKEAWVEKERRRPSSLQDFLLEWLADLQKNYTTGLLTSSKQLSESLKKAEQTRIFREARVVATTLLLEVYETRRNVQVTQMVHDYEVDYKKLNPDSPDQWKAKLKQSLSEDAKTKKMISKQIKAGPLNVFVSILTQLVFIVDGPDGCPQLENVDLLFKVVHQNGYGEQKPLSSEKVSPLSPAHMRSSSFLSHILVSPLPMKFDPLLCQHNLKRRWQENIFESREVIVSLISNQIKKGNKGLPENVIRPRATTLVLRLVARFGTHGVLVPENCRTNMPSFCSLVFDETKVGVVHAYCKVITQYVCFLLEEQEQPTEENPLWLPRSLLVWVNDATDKSKNPLVLMPTITLAKASINQFEDKSMCVSELLVSILENPDDSLSSLKQSIEDHCHQHLQLQQHNKEEKKQKKPGKGPLAARSKYIDDQAGILTPKTEHSSDDSQSVVSGQDLNGGIPWAHSDLDIPSSITNRKLDYDESPELKKGINQDGSAATAGAPTMQNRLQAQSEPQLSPPVHKFLMAQLSLNHGALPNALVDVVETGVNFMAQQRFANYDSILRSYNEPAGQAKRRKLNVEYMGHMYHLIEKLMTLHAQDLERLFFDSAEDNLDWSKATGGILNLVEKPRLVRGVQDFICIGNEMLGRPGQPTGSSVGQKQDAKKKPADGPTKPTANGSSSSNKEVRGSPMSSPPTGSTVGQSQATSSSSASKHHNDGSDHKSPKAATSSSSTSKVIDLESTPAKPAAQCRNISPVIRSPQLPSKITSPPLPKSTTNLGMASMSKGSNDLESTSAKPAGQGPNRSPRTPSKSTSPLLPKSANKLGMASPSGQTPVMSPHYRQKLPKPPSQSGKGNDR